MLYGYVGRLAMLAGLSTMLLGMSAHALAAHDAADEVGRWHGFGHQTGEIAPGSDVILDLMHPAGAGPLVLQGTINGLPAVQRTFRATGRVTPEGRLTLSLNGDGMVGFCDGSVRPVENFGRGDGQDDLGSLDYVLLDSNGRLLSGHVNLLHLFGGMDWQAMSTRSLIGEGDGAFIPGGADQAGISRVRVGDQSGSSLIGLLRLGDFDFNMIGTLNGRGSLIMMCDGSVRNADTGVSALIGLLFTGGVAPSPLGAEGGPAQIVGHYGAGGFATLLPAVQKIREAALSVRIGG